MVDDGVVDRCSGGSRATVPGGDGVAGVDTAAPEHSVPGIGFTEHRVTVVLDVGQVDILGAGRGVVGLVESLLVQALN